MALPNEEFQCLESCQACRLHEVYDHGLTYGKYQIYGPSNTKKIIYLAPTPRPNSNQHDSTEDNVDFISQEEVEFLRKFTPDMIITPIVKCIPYADSLHARNPRRPIKQERDHCLKVLDYQIKHVFKLKPEEVLLVSMGPEAAKSFSATASKSSSSLLGKITPVSIGNTSYAFTMQLHPSQVMNNSALMIPYKETARFVRQVTSGDAVPTEAEAELYSKSKILDPDKAVSFLEGMIESYHAGKIPWTVFDIETTSLTPDTGEIIMFIFSYPGINEGVTIPTVVSNIVHHPPEKYPHEVKEIDFTISNEQRRKINNLVKQVIELIPIVGHNLKFDVRWCYHHLNLDLQKVRIQGDTYLMSKQFFNYPMYRLSLKKLCKDIFGVRDEWDTLIDEYLQLFKLKVDRHYGQVPTSILGLYGGLDGFWNKALYQELSRHMKDDFEPILSEVTYATIPYSEIETKGVKINEKTLDFLRSAFERKINQCENAIRELPPVKKFIAARMPEILDKNTRKRVKWTEEEIQQEALNLKSNAHLQELFYSKEYFKFKPLEKFLTKSGKAYKTGDDVISYFLADPKLAKKKREFLELLSDFKIYQKLVQSYINSFPQDVYDGFYKADFNIDGTVTGRLSSKFHTIPTRTMDIKRVFESRWAEDGGLFACADQSQVELRVGASLSNETKMIQSYIEGIDIHSNTASNVYNKPVDEITKLERSKAKIVNFSIFYGKGVTSLAQDLGVTVDEAQEIMNGFFQGHDKLTQWIHDQQEFVKEHKYITTPTGRRIWIDAAFSTEPGKLGQADRCAVNYPVQSTASDLVTVAANQVYRGIKSEGMKSLFLGTVHDSQEFDVYPGELISLIHLIKKENEDNLRARFPFIKCPLVMDISVGTTWGGSIDFEVKELGGSYVVLEGTGFRKDVNALIYQAQKAYDIESRVIEEETLSEHDFGKDVIIRDHKKITVELSIYTKNNKQLT